MPWQAYVTPVKTTQFDGENILACTKYVDAIMCIKYLLLFALVTLGIFPEFLAISADLDSYLLFSYFCFTIIYQFLPSTFLCDCSWVMCDI